MEQKQNRVPPRPRRRRRLRRFVAVLVFAVAMFGLAWFFESQSTTTLIFVRHADTDASMDAGGDPPLNARGRERAALLADFLEDVDVVASVDAVYASEFKRTQQTAAVLAERLGLEVGVADHQDAEAFMDRVLREHRGKIVLIVTHRDTIAPLIRQLHGSKNVPPIADDEYDNVYIVTIPWGGGAKVKTLRLHYAQTWSPGPRSASGFSSRE